MRYRGDVGSRRWGRECLPEGAGEQRGERHLVHDQRLHRRDGREDGRLGRVLVLVDVRQEDLEVEVAVVVVFATQRKVDRRAELSVG